MSVAGTPTYSLLPELRTAFGGLLSIPSLFLGSVSFFHQITGAYPIHLSRLLQEIRAAYEHYVHGAVEVTALTVSSMTELDLPVPPWSLNWIVLWVVGAGAMYRLYSAVRKIAANEHDARDAWARNVGNGILMVARDLSP